MAEEEAEAEELFAAALASAVLPPAALVYDRRLVGVSRRVWTLGQPNESGNMRINAHIHSNTYKYIHT